MNFILGFIVGVIAVICAVIFVGLPRIRKKFFDDFNLILCNIVCERVLSLIKDSGVITDVGMFTATHERAYGNSDCGYDDCLILMSQIHDDMDHAARDSEEHSLVIEARNFFLICKKAEGENVYHSYFQNLNKKL